MIPEHSLLLYKLLVSSRTKNGSHEDTKAQGDTEILRNKM